MKQKLYNYVYLTINAVNGKCYIGSHQSEYKKDKYLGSGNLIVHAIKKYGKENFIKIILKNCDTILEARLNEGIYIEKFDTLSPNGYNISPSGGCNFKNGITSEETRKKLSKSLKGRKLSPNHIEAVRKKLIGRKRDPKDSIKAWKTRKENGNNIPWNKGKKGIYSEETKLKISLARKNKSMSEVTKFKIHQSLKGKELAVNNKFKECEYCKRVMNIGNYNRWHGNNCKHKNI